MQALDTQTTIAVIGAGAMGSGIAQVAAQAGHKVYLHDQRDGAATAGRDGIAKQLQRRVDKGKMEQQTVDAIVGRIQPVSALSEVADSRMVIEAIVEDLEIKHSLLADLEELCGEDAILATNTSSISVTALGAKLRHPKRLVGMHFFNPAPLMALVEVVKGLATDNAVAEIVHATAANWGKKPVFATSTPGFIVNRVARPFYAESLRLLQEGAADPATLDAIIRESGNFRMGPFELTDLIGHDVNYAVTNSVFKAYYQDARFLPSLIQKELVEAGRLGRKSGQGFYSYTDGSERPAPDTEPARQSDDTTLVVEGDLGPASALINRFRDAGLEIVERDGPGQIRFGDAVLALTDGRMATERAQAEGTPDLTLFDLAFDFGKATRLAVCFSDQASEKARHDAVALLQKTNIAVSAVKDRPGLVVMRTVATLANEAADAELHGVATKEDIDLAMKAGLNYPEGPLSWSDRLGNGRVLQTLTNIQNSYGEDRYRPALLLRKNHHAGKGFYK
ncbi:3-hydroxyacyl-CoA dehydrogenase PaaH [Marinobacter sp.]|jgi:3-hydroxybutyryl-CoA dehydrogenase|uniref:3-hydroxyacyl-CoA dehydrogenase PaaH n=1 Tax=Marinobacter sp. TaxID=50741 RepID=UPI000C51A466|nr:3-hydroxyacyl-CoA dehydrogenase PaaH [Marinobacter sp.]MBE96447.1 3-hydroxyacyl-CoA dehydrogenase PaaC [Marinobacter sp.]MBP55078.1 3-hydroxyacyl-CoA dehydrogenase PaaC [Marinobacter sp.]|tara:strand:+ start:1411 stop:2931 length:1521 start_codon:yes stop_codon:yes gene_type:complete